MDDLEFGTSIVSTAYGAYLDHAYAQNLANHLLCTFVANLKINAIYALYPESFCDKNLAIRKVFAFCDSERTMNGKYDFFTTRDFPPHHACFPKMRGLFVYPHCTYSAILSSRVRGGLSTKADPFLWDIRMAANDCDICH